MSTARLRTGDAAKSKRTATQTDNAVRVMDRYFGVRGGELLVGGLSVSELADTFGSPLFVYDKDIIRLKLRELRSALTPRFQVYYSIKANPNAAILKCFLNEGCGLEIASGGELHQALEAGCPPQKIIFAGPGKSTAELAAALDAGIREIHVESIEEARTLAGLSRERGMVAPIALRINPVDSSGGAMRMGGTASPFGIDEEELDHVIDEVAAEPHLAIKGVHLFMGTQILDADVLIGQYRRAVSIASRVAERVGPLETIDLGGGWGTPYFAHEHELDLDAVADGIAALDKEIEDEPLLANATAIVEPGRFLVNEAGIYLARVTRTKRSRGKTYAITDGGMHHHLAASGNLGQTIKRNYPLAVVNRLDQAQALPTEVVGPLCTPLDTIGRNAALPAVIPGDLVGVFLSGAYARTASPLGFLSHAAPAEVMVADGSATLIRRRGVPEDFLRDQVGIETQDREKALSDA